MTFASETRRRLVVDPSAFRRAMMAIMLSATVYALFALDAYYSAGPRERDNDWIMCVPHGHICVRATLPVPCERFRIAYVCGRYVISFVCLLLFIFEWMVMTWCDPGVHSAAVHSAAGTERCSALSTAAL